MHIGVMGAGYVGLVTGACLAEIGNHVTIVDIDAEKIATLQRGESPHFEPGLGELLAQNLRGNRLKFSTDSRDAAVDKDVVFIAVGTPMSDSGAADLRYVYAAAETVAKNITRRAVMVIKSTVPVGTNASVRHKISDVSSGEFALISNPEFLKEGAAITDFMKPDRIVIGVRAGVDQWAENVMRQIYAPFVKNGHPLMFMDPESAEMVKYVSNALLACKISFINEVANVCAKFGADIERVRGGVAADQRLGGAFLYAGIGYGGSCFPKDVRALLHTAEAAGVAAPLCAAIDAVNVAQRLALLPFIEKRCGRDLRGKKFAIWGLAFKPNTDDVREAPAIYLINELLNRGAEIVAYDPQAKNTAQKALPASVRFSDNAYAAVEKADALIICTEWLEFRVPDFIALKAALKQPLIFDGRNLYDLDAPAAHGFSYYSIGRPPVETGK